MEDQNKFRVYNDALFHTSTCENKECNYNQGRCLKVRSSIDHFTYENINTSDIKSCQACGIIVFSCSLLCNIHLLMMKEWSTEQRKTAAEGNKRLTFEILRPSEAQRYPSIKRKEIIQDIRIEFRENQHLTDTVKIAEQHAMAKHGLEQLAMYCKLDPSQSNWTVHYAKEKETSVNTSSQNTNETKNGQ